MTHDCPFCCLIAGVETERNRLDDVVWRDGRTLAFVSPRWWPPTEGNVMVAPLKHVEDLYVISDEDLAAVYVTVKLVAVAMRASYGCEGISTRQHNEPGGGQDVPRFHVHVFPRWHDDRLYERNAVFRWATQDERAPFGRKLRSGLGSLRPQTA
ncbi:MAG TPA: HIT family protein [Gaiellaceae bacterium]|nr:HIT family protein [Gaiellaceae bacterium]